MKRKVWRSGNSFVVTIPSEIAEKLDIMEDKLIDFDIRNVFEETEKIFNNIFTKEERFLEPLNKINRGLKLFRQPLSDLKETNKEVIAIIEIPGVDKKDIELNITENNLDVKVEKKSEIKVEDKNKGFFRSERSYNGFYRSINLPCKIVPEKAKASYKNGILEVIIPKVTNDNIKKSKIEIE